MGIRLDGTTDTISAPGSDLNLGQSGDSVKVASEVQLPTHGTLSNRRININGAMQVAQRGTVTNAGNEYGGPEAGTIIDLNITRGTKNLVVPYEVTYKEGSKGHFMRMSRESSASQEQLLELWLTN